EHLLLGLLSDEHGSPGEVLRAAGARFAAARHKVSEVVGADISSSTGESVPFSARARRALERAGRFARQDREPEVSSAHVLLGVLDVEGLACQVLRGLGVDLARLRDAVVGVEPEVVVVRPDEPVVVTVVRPLCPECGADLDDTLSETLVAARRDDGEPTIVSVVYCCGCGTTIGAMRPGPSS
ncbi:MAG: Clp protease N-terminal domain-containing protein, partial [Actinobacteria bacterium]|nr:Clp protease N-terminal domain-containing protein [Actinomycetota bacterium]